MSVRILATLALSFAVGCASHEGPPKSDDTSKPETKDPQTQDPQTQDPDPDETPKEQARRVDAAIASVQMIEDCPHDDPPPLPSLQPTPPEPPQAARMAMPMPIAEGDVEAGSAADGAGMGPHSFCTQSTMQISIRVDDAGPAKVRIEALRLLQPTTYETLGTVEARLPTAWKPDGRYEAWDETVPAGTEIKASYRLSMPDWSAVEREIGVPSFGHMFVIEADVEIDGQRRTVRSPQFPRERPHVVVT